MTPQKNFNHDHAARYLVLLHQDDATRALLFAQDSRFLSEVIDDDGLVIDNLTKSGKACMAPREVADQVTMPANMLCFALEAEEQAEVEAEA